MKKIIFLILLSLITMSKDTFASHAAAVDLTYECLGGNQYRFTLKLYRDCAGSSLPGSVNINFESILCGGNFNLNLARTSVTEVSQICDTQINNTTCGSGSLPGIEEHVYTGTTTLPSNCTDWRASYTLCCRNSAITNIAGGSLYTDVRIDNTSGNCNNSPTFNSGIPILYACVGDPVNFNNAAIDADGDSLTFTLVNPWSGNNNNLNYNDPSFNPTNPMFTSGGFIFDSVTGQITFTSPGLQQAVVSVLINEYDSLGNWKGSIRRDIQFIIINCPPPVFEPVVTGVNYDSTNFTFNACYTDAFCFDIYGTSGDPAVPLIITYDGGIPSGSFTTTQNADTTFGVFCWNPGLSIGDYTFTLRLEADICPIKRVNVFNYTVHIDTTFTNCTDSTVYIDAFGTANIDSTYVVGTPNSCVIQSVTLDQSVFDCSDIGANSINVRSLYSNGLIKNCISQITISDTLPPTAVCKDTSIYIDASASFIIDSSFIDNGSMDNCAIQSMSLSRYNFNCTDLGVNVVTLYVTDIYGNIDSCIANVTVVDSILPTPICRNTTIYLNPGGNFIIDSSFIDNGSSDICGVSTITLSNYNYTCANIGANTVTMYVTDMNGNIDSCTAIVFVFDTVAPALICQDTSIYLNAAGSFTIGSSFIENGSSDACGITTITLSNYNYTCANTGTNSITMYVTDVNGNIDSCLANVIVFDTINPTPICKDTAIYLNTSGILTIDSSFVDNGSNDNCNVASITLSQYNFNCSDTGVNIITMYVVDESNNIDSCLANITIIDTVGPVALCKDTTIYLNLAGNYTIDSSYIDNGSSDACGVLTISQSLFDCSHIGPNNVTLYVTDLSLNQDSCSALVTVMDTTRPTTICKDTTIYLNLAGSFTIDSSFINNNSNDACGVATITLSQYNFNCTNIGTNSVAMIVTDVNGNTNACIANVVVIDTTSPNPICKDTTIYLNVGGLFTIDSSFINNVSNDGCGVATIALDRYFFDCSDTGTSVIKMYVTDFSGNIDSCSANITVIDTIGPVALCKDTTIYLNASGLYTIDSSFIDNGSSDACGILTISQSLFDCSHIGPNSVNLYAIDANFNLDSCTATVNVLDTINPIVICKDTLIYLNASGQFIIDSNFINNGSSDACGIASISLSKYSFNCADTGVNTVLMTVTDVNGNIDSCFATVIVRDSIIPYVNAGIDDSLCAQYTYVLNGNVPAGTLIGTWRIINAPNIPLFSSFSQGNASITSLIEGSHTFSWTITNGLGCNIVADTVNIYVYDQPVSNAGTDTSLCNAYAMNMRANIPAGLASGAWTYLTPAPSVPIIANPTDPFTNVSGLVEGNYTFIWTVSNGNCTPITSPITISVYDLPVSNAGNNQDLCNTYNTILLGNTPGGSSTGLWTVISGPNAPTITTPSSAVSGLNGMTEGTYTITWTVSNGTCSPVIDTLLVNVYNQPISNAGTDTNLCAIYNLNLYANIPLGTAYGQWIVNPNSSPPGTPVFTDSSIYNTNVSGLVEGTYKLLWIVINGNCTAAIDSLTIYVWDRPIVYTGIDSSLCSIYNLNLYAIPIMGLSSGQWILDPNYNNPNAPNITNATQPNASVTGFIEGTYRFIWKVKNGSCFDISDTIIINIYDQPTAIVGPDQDLCFLNSTVINAVALNGKATGAWNLASGTPNIPTFNPNSSSTVGNMQEGGNYTLYWEAMNGTCPVSRDSIVINNYAVPIAQFTQDSVEVCRDQCIQFTNQSTIHPSDIITNYQWNATENAYYTENPEICWPYTGLFDVQLIVESSHGCRDTINKTDLIAVNTIPVADFNTFLVDDPNSSTKIRIQDNSQFSIRYWYSLGDGTTTNVQNPEHNYADSGLYDIIQIVSNTFGCKDTLRKAVFVHVLIVYTPNTFTPDGNGVNDTFFPSVSGDDPDAFLFRVFNRWGEIIFQTQIKNHGWDGTNEGQSSKTDTYVWTLVTKYKDGDRRKEYRGHINLLR
jgi:gliding motility-associated-like protein